jgi:hypothetical protein
VRSAVEFDDQFGFGTKEVCDVGADRCLSAEAKSRELFSAQQRPELAFAFGRGSAEVTGA